MKYWAAYVLLVLRRNAKLNADDVNKVLKEVDTWS